MTTEYTDTGIKKFMHPYSIKDVLGKVHPYPTVQYTEYFMNTRSFQIAIAPARAYRGNGAEIRIHHAPFQTRLTEEWLAKNFPGFFYSII